MTKKIWQLRPRIWDKKIWVLEKEYWIDLWVRSDMRLSTFLKIKWFGSLSKILDNK